MKRSKHTLSHHKLSSINMGGLYPIGLLEVLPGDSIQHSTSALVRCSPLLAPVMHPVNVHIRHFFVPNRIIWDQWENFITGGPDGRDSSVPPTIDEPVTVGSLHDHFGLPISDTGLEVSALPFRAYNMVWNEFFRDQDLQDPVEINLGSGSDDTTSTRLLQTNWEKDYFTSARPWEQKGPTITIPLGTTAPVRTTGEPVGLTDSSGSHKFMRAENAGGGLNISSPPSTNNQTVKFSDPIGLQTDLTGASAVTVNILREAMALQRYEEARARFGSRYTEYLRYLGVRSSDARMQRPEYLGGGKQTIQFSEVLQTAEGTDPVGDLKGHGIAAMRSNRYRRFFEEHGWVISLMSVRPKTMYMQGIHRHWSRRIKEDYWQRELQHIGAQEVLNKELYAAHTNPEGTFGFQDRYDEYRYMESGVAGEFRNSMLNYWHLGREFASQPALNSAFVTCNPSERIFASPNTDVLYVMAHHSIQARRMISRTGEPFIY